MQVGHLLYVASPDFRVTAVRHVEHSVEPAEDGQTLVDGIGGKDAELLRRQLVFGYAVEMIERGHGTPTEIQRTLYVATGPVEYAVDLTPVVDVLVGNGLYGRTRDDHAIELLLHEFL